MDKKSDESLARDVIEGKMQTLKGHVYALKGAINAIPINSQEPTAAQMIEIHELFSIIVNSMEASVDTASHEIISYVKTWIP